MVDIVVLNTIVIVIATCFSGFVSGLGSEDVGKPNLDKKNSVCSLIYAHTYSICTQTHRSSHKYALLVVVIAQVLEPYDERRDLLHIVSTLRL